MKIIFNSFCKLVVLCALLATPLTAGGKTQKENSSADSCLCDKLLDWKENLNYKMFTNGWTMNTIKEMVNRHMNEIPTQLAKVMPGQVDVPEVLNSRFERGTQSRKMEMVNDNFFYNRFKRALETLVVEPFPMTPSELYTQFRVPIKDSMPVDSTKGTFEAYSYLSYRLRINIPRKGKSYSGKVEDNLEKLMFEHRGTQTEEVLFMIRVKQYRRPNISGYEMTFFLDRQWYRDVSKPTKKYAYLSSILNPEFFSTLGGDGYNYNISQYYRNFVDVTICNNTIAFLSKMFSMFTYSDITSKLQNRMDGCLGVEGVGGVINEDELAVGSIFPIQVRVKPESELDLVDPMIKEMMVDKFLKEFNHQKFKVREFQDIESSAYDIYYEKEDTFYFMLFTVYRKVHLFESYYNSMNNNMNLITDYSSNYNIYKDQKILMWYLMVVRVFGRYYMEHHSAVQEHYLYNLTSLFGDRTPLWYSIMIDLANFYAYTEEQAGGSMWPFISADDGQNANIAKWLLEFSKHSSAFQSKITELGKIYNIDTSVQSNVYKNRLYIIAFMTSVVRFLYFTGGGQEFGLLGSSKEHSATGLYNAVEGGSHENMTLEFIFSKLFLELDVSEIVYGNNNVEIIDMNTILLQERKHQFVEIDVRNKKSVVRPIKTPEVVEDSEILIDNTVKMGKTGNNDLLVHTEFGVLVLEQDLSMDNSPFDDENIEIVKTFKLRDIKNSGELLSQNDEDFLQKKNRQPIIMDLLTDRETNFSGKRVLKIEKEEIIERDLFEETRQKILIINEFIIHINMIIDTANVYVDKDYKKRLRAREALVAEYKQKRKRIKVDEVAVPKVYKHLRLLSVELSDYGQNIPDINSALLKQLQAIEFVDDVTPLKTVFNITFGKIEAAFHQEGIENLQSHLSNIKGELKTNHHDQLLKDQAFVELLKNQELEMRKVIAEYDEEEQARIDEEMRQQLINIEKLRVIEQDRLDNIEKEKQRILQLQILEKQRIEREKIATERIVIDFVNRESDTRTIFAKDIQEYVQSPNKWTYEKLLSGSDDSQLNNLISQIFQFKLATQQEGEWGHTRLMIHQRLIDDMPNLHNISRSSKKDYDRRIIRLICLSTILKNSQKNIDYMNAKNTFVITRNGGQTNVAGEISSPGMIVSNNDMQQQIKYMVKRIRYEIFIEVKTYFLSATDDTGSSLFDYFKIQVDSDFHILIHTQSKQKIREYYFHNQISEENDFVDEQMLTLMMKIKTPFLKQERVQFKINVNGNIETIDKDINEIFLNLCKQGDFMDEVKKQAFNQRRMELDRLAEIERVQLLAIKEREKQLRLKQQQADRDYQLEQIRVQTLLDEQLKLENQRIQIEFNKQQVREQQRLAKLKIDNEKKLAQQKIEQDKLRYSETLVISIKSIKKERVDLDNQKVIVQEEINIIDSNGLNKKTVLPLRTELISGSNRKYSSEFGDNMNFSSLHNFDNGEDVKKLYHLESNLNVRDYSTLERTTLKSSLSSKKHTVLIPVTQDMQSPEITMRTNVIVGKHIGNINSVTKVVEKELISEVILPQNVNQISNLNSRKMQSLDNFLGSSNSVSMSSKKVRRNVKSNKNFNKEFI